jgi:hypothetical protein
MWESLKRSEDLDTQTILWGTEADLKATAQFVTLDVVVECQEED